MSSIRFRNPSEQKQLISHERLIYWIKKHLFVFSEEWGRKEPFDWHAVVVILCGSLLIWPLAMKLPALGWDWHTYFHARKFIGGYPPWLGYILAFPINLPARVGYGLIISLMMVTVAIATAREARSYSRAS